MLTPIRQLGLKRVYVVYTLILMACLCLMSFLGLVPSEYSSGGKEKRGAITKSGNQFVRRMLVEAAHHAGKHPNVGVGVKKRSIFLNPKSTDQDRRA